MKSIKVILVLVVVGLSNFVAISQTIVKGVVLDSISKAPIPFSFVQFSNTELATVADMDGAFELSTTENVTEITVSSLGYNETKRKIKPGVTQNIKISISKVVNNVAVVEIKRKKKRYRNKDNPAVVLIRNVIKHKKYNRLEAFDFYQYQEYEKVQFSLGNVTEEYKNKKMFKKYQFVFDNLDTTTIKDEAILPVYIAERIADKYYRRKPKATKEIIKGEKSVSFYGVDASGMEQYLSYLYQDINVYDNNITILTNQFLSPLAPSAPTFYKFYLKDTIEINGTRCVELSFFPRNNTDLLFIGSIFISLDGRYSVIKNEMKVSDEVNLNWVRKLSIKQEFEQYDDSTFVLKNDEFLVDFGLSGNSKRGLVGKRTVSKDKLLLNHAPDSNIYGGLLIELDDSSALRTNNYWDTTRHSELSTSESGTYESMDSLQNMPAFRRTMDIVMLVLSGYKTFGMIDVGPMNTFYSFNPIEGFRPRIGGTTNNKFSKKLKIEGYGAYGFVDKKFKYFVASKLSVGKGDVGKFPENAISASYQNDTKIPGQELQFIQEDNILLSLKRGLNDKWLYNKIFRVNYLKEFKNHTSFEIGYKNWEQAPAGGLIYANSDGSHVTSITTSEAMLRLRWAPNEKYYQGKSFKRPIINGYPIFTLTGINGIKGVMGGEYNFQNVSLNVFKRLYLSQLGFADIVLNAGKIFGDVPFPLMKIHRANQTYSYQIQSYNLMNFLEFVSDRYVGINIDYHFAGFFMNKVPLIKKLKWRIVSSAKLLYGGIGDNNNPALNSNTLSFTKDADGDVSTYEFGAEPYFEGGVGIENIFKIFRIDLLRRFTYLEHKEVAKLGLRVRFKLQF